MPHEELIPGEPADWLRHARSDLALSRAPRAAEILLEAYCFHAQQAAEKALKAILVAKGIKPPKTHNIRSLLDLMPPSLIPPEEVQEAAILTDYAVLSRYPADLEPVSEEEYLGTVRLAEAVVSWAEMVLKS